MSYPIIMHINYCEQGQSLAETCRKAVGWGFDGVEFRRSRKGRDETVGQYLDEIQSAVEASGLSLVLFGSPGPQLLSPDPDVRRRDVDRAVDFYTDVHQRFGVTTANLLTGSLHNPDENIPYSDYTRHGSFIATDEQIKWQVDGCREMADRLSGTGIKFGFETHMVYLHDTVDAALRLVAAIDRPSIGINLDYGNQLHMPEHPPLEDAVSLAKDHLHYVHLKNSVPVHGTAGRIATGLAEGEINNREFVRLLASVGYKGPLCIESPRGGDREWFAPADIGYLKSVLADLGL